MLRPALDPGGGMLIETGSIHTFFMRFPIDVIYLDREGTILRLTPAMAPARIGPVLTHGCHQVLELPAGTIEATGCQVGDHLVMEPGG